jgi:hypothetical protein
MTTINPLAVVGLAVGIGIVVLFSLVNIFVRLRRAPRKETYTPSAMPRNIDCEAALSTHSSMTLVEKDDSEWQRFDFGFEEPDTFYKDLPKVATTLPKMPVNASITRPEVAHLLTRQSRLSACLPFTALDYDDDRGRIPESPWGKVHEAMFSWDETQLTRSYRQFVHQVCGSKDSLVSTPGLAR